MTPAAPLRFGILGLAMALAACGCVTTTAESEEAPKATATPLASQTPHAAKKAPATELRVSAKWQEILQELLAESKASEAVGLFSAGGWSNSGQTFVLLSKDRKVRDVIVVPANKTTKDAMLPKRDLSDAELAKVETALKLMMSLSDVDVESFDSLEFEVVRLQKSADGKIQALKRVYVRDPTSTPKPKHAAVISALEGLRKK